MRPSIVRCTPCIRFLLLFAVGPLPLHAQTLHEQTPPAQRAMLVRSSSGAALDGTPSNMRNPSPAPALPATAWTATSPTAPRANSMVVTASGLSDAENANGSGVHNAFTASVPGSLPSDRGAANAKRTPLNPTQRDAAGDEDGGGAKSTLQMLVSMGSSLLIVLGLFLGAAWFYRKSISTSLGAGIPKQVVDVLGRTPIAARQQLVLVRFGSKLVLVSIVQGEARAISEIDEPLEVDRLAGLCESSKPGSISQSFRSILAQGGAA